MSAQASAARKAPTVSQQLTAELALALLTVKDGADVFSMYLARNLREVEAKFPDYVEITKAKAPAGEARERQPYFGAIATFAGIAEAEHVAVWGQRS